MGLKITFWGVRGSVPTSGRDTVIYGGNTPCVQVETDKRNLIFDGGTGIVKLGDKMMEEKGVKDTDIFFSHMHWDHIQGLPFFTPFYYPGNHFRLYGHDGDNKTLKEIITGQMVQPYFPITMEIMKSEILFKGIEPDMVMDMGYGVIVKTFALDHPGGSLSYRIESGDNSVVYCTDTETLYNDSRKKLIRFIKGADVLIYDAYFTGKEYLKLGAKWGHSTWEEGTALSNEADISHLILFHHMRNRKDHEQELIENSARLRFENTFAAKEGMVITVGGDITEKVVVNYPY